VGDIDKWWCLSYIVKVRYFDWNAAKNEILKTEREVSFEEVVTAIQEGRLLKVGGHPNQKKYPGQKVMIVDINDYAYVVPYVQNKERIFFKTIYPSRMATKLYIVGKK